MVGAEDGDDDVDDEEDEDEDEHDHDHDDDDDDDDDDVDDDDAVVTFNTQVAKLCVARWKPWSCTCGILSHKTTVFFWCSDMLSASARANWGVCPQKYYS